MNKKFEVVDDNGNIIQPPDPASDVGKLLYLMEYCRARGFALGPEVQVGDVVVRVRDLRLERQQRGGEPERDIWSEHGHDLK